MLVGLIYKKERKLVEDATSIFGGVSIVYRLWLTPVSEDIFPGPFKLSGVGP